MNTPANDPKLKSWIPVPKDSDFPIQNIPFGIGEARKEFPRMMTRIGDHAICLRELFDAGLLDGLELGDGDLLVELSLNYLIMEGPVMVRALRDRLSFLLREDTPDLRDNAELRKKAVIPVEEMLMYLPANVGDYTDFYSSRQHAYNVGCMFRDPANALLPNWLHMPVGDRKSVV